MREYFHTSKHLARTETDKTVMGSLSPALQGELAWRLNRGWMRRVWFLQYCEVPFMVQLALSLEARVYAPGESITNSTLCIIHRGVVLYGGRVLTAGRVWGEDILLQSQHLRCKWIAKAMNHVELFLISREELLELAALYPVTFASMRRRQVKLALRCDIIQRAKMHLGLTDDEFLIDSGSSFLSNKRSGRHRSSVLGMTASNMAAAASNMAMASASVALASANSGWSALSRRARMTSPRRPPRPRRSS